MKRAHQFCWFHGNENYWEYKGDVVAAIVDAGLATRFVLPGLPIPATTSTRRLEGDRFQGRQQNLVRDA